MAGNNRYTALLDANVLYSVAISDALMEVAATGIYAAKWSKQVDKEWVKNLAFTPEKFVDALERNGLIQTAAFLRQALQLI
jgi:hypothetical protein